MIVGELKRAADADRNALRGGLEALGDQIFENRADRDATIRLSALARYVFYAALVKGDGKAPSWDALLQRYASIRREIGDDPLPKGADPGTDALPEIDDRHLLINFCGFKTWTRGSQDKRFYAAMAVLAVRLSEDNAVSNDAMFRALLPIGEDQLPARIMASLRAIVAACCNEDVAAANPPTAANDEAADAPIVPQLTLSFDADMGRVRRFADYCAHFTSPSDGYAHFVMYRPSRSRPDRLMKTFLALRSPTEDDDPLFRFNHQYRPPDQGGSRVTIGRAFPLEGGVYLIGGQRETSPARQAFQTLKVVAIPWFAIDHPGAEIPTLILSANREGFHLLSRAVLRPTLVDNSSKLKLGGVEIGDLLNDLKADALAERAQLKSLLPDVATDGPEWPVAIKPWIDRFPLCGDDGEIDWRGKIVSLLELSNNRPRSRSAWGVGPAFEAINGDQMLTTVSLHADLERAYGSSSAKKYKRALNGAFEAEPEVFEFWSSLRFGPLKYRD